MIVGIDNANAVGGDSTPLAQHECQMYTVNAATDNEPVQMHTNKSEPIVVLQLRH
jgi:hypothetical protein